MSMMMPNPERTQIFMKPQDGIMIEKELFLPNAWTQAATIVSRKGARRPARASSTVKKVVSGLWGELDRFVLSSASGGQVKNGLSTEHSEAMFRSLLASERMRSKRSGAEFQVFLVSLSTTGGLPVSIDDDMASNLFAALRRCLRGTDYIGWYQDRLALGAVLTALGSSQLTEVSCQVEQRFIDVLSEELSVNDFNKIQFRSCQYHELEAGGVSLGAVRSYY